MFCTRQTSQSQASSGFLNLSPSPNTGVLLADEVASAEAPGFGLVQATHLVSSALFCTIHVSHSHAPSGFLNLSPNPVNPVDAGTAGVDKVLTAEKAEGRVRDGFSPVPGLAVSHATHFTASGLLITRHVSQSQVPVGLENNVPKPVVVVIGLFVLLLSWPTEGAGDCLFSVDLDEELGCGAAQQTHFVSDNLFGTQQTSQVQSVEALKTPANPAEEEGFKVVVVGAVDCSAFGWVVALGLGET